MTSCPVCGSPVVQKPRGRPAEFCKKVCRERARQRRRQAARLLEYADRIEEGIGRPGFGSRAHLRERAAHVRAMAGELLSSIGELVEASEEDAEA